MWSGYFTNIRFGFTNKITQLDKASLDQKYTRTQHHLIVKQLPLSQMLLETDSPYFPLMDGCSLPGETLSVAKWIADLKSITIYEVLDATKSNAKDTYRLW